MLVCALLVGACGDDGRDIASVRSCLEKVDDVVTERVDKERGVGEGVLATRPAVGEPGAQIIAAAALMDSAGEVEAFQRDVKRSAGELESGSKTVSGDEGRYVWVVSYGPEASDVRAVRDCVEP
jgi:hypothetical protein